MRVLDIAQALDDWTSSVAADPLAPAQRPSELKSPQCDKRECQRCQSQSQSRAALSAVG
jgi:hypothetical protein